MPCTFFMNMYAYVYTFAPYLTLIHPLVQGAQMAMLIEQKENLAMSNQAIHFAVSH